MYTTSDFGAFDARRRSVLMRELGHALYMVKDRELRNWALQVPETAVEVSLRRGRNAKATVLATGRWIRDEWKWRGKRAGRNP